MENKQYIPDVTVFKTIFNTKDRAYKISIDEVFTRIKTGKGKVTKDVVTKIRSIKNHDKIQELKKQLPAIMFNGEFQTRNDDAIIQHSGLCIFDFDKYPDIETMMQARDILIKDKYTYSCFVSPSGKGLRIIVSGSVPEDYKNHPAGFEVFHSKGFVTLTGAKPRISPGKITALAAAPRIAGAIRKYSTAQGNSQNTPPGGADKDGAMLRMLDREQALSSIDEAVLPDIAAALGVLSSDAADDYHEWIKVGLALKSLAGAYPKEAHELWHSYSAKSGKYTPEDSESRWEGFSPSSISYRTIFSMADAVSRVWRQSQAGSAHNASIWEPIDYDLTRPVATDWLIKGIIPTGLGIFAGQPGAGKSSCLLPLVIWN